MAGILAQTWLLVACLIIVRCAAGPTDVSTTVSTKECESHEQCPTDRACEASQCIDPCEGRCGNNTFCETRHHWPNCQCSPGYIGNPLVNCEWPECYIHEDCLVKMSCIASKCEDPCRGRCGNNAECLVHQHIANCACKKGYTGNALVNCERLECETHDQCAADRACVASKCEDPCRGRCGNNAECLVHQHIANCACKKGYTGNALVNCERLECETHDQCVADRACVASKCEDPCRGRCGNNAECLVHQHIANCACKPGYVGNPLTECYDIQKKTYFIVITQKMTFYKSLEYCKNNGMRLATFHNEEEFKQLSDSIAFAGYLNTDYWVAGSDLAERDVWRWYTTGREMTYLPWATYEPNHRTNETGTEEQHCVVVWRYSSGSVDIHDEFCSYSAYPICDY